MFDIAWTEMLILVLITLLVVGPKDLPKVVRAVGGMVRKARDLAGEFQQGLDQLSREAELQDIKNKTADIGRIDPTADFKRSVDPTTGMDLPTGPKPDRGGGEHGNEDDAMAKGARPPEGTSPGSMPQDGPADRGATDRDAPARSGREDPVSVRREDDDRGDNT